MARILLTGAAGDIGTRLRKILKPVYPKLRLSDIKERLIWAPMRILSPPSLPGSRTSSGPWMGSME